MKKILYNGVEIPSIGLGTWQIPCETAVSSVQNAIDVGYTHIDTACAYKNEKGVGEGVKKSGKDRKEIFITSKIPAEYKTCELARQTIENTLKNLDTDYVDLMLIHAPRPWAEMHKEDAYDYNKENIEVWKVLEEEYKKGRIRGIGVSNFKIKDLENIINNCEIKPMVNQIMAYITAIPYDTIEFCEKKGIVTEAYSPLATGRIFANGKIKTLAERYDVSMARFCIKCVSQLGMVVLPKTTNRERMIENALLDFNISKEDMEAIKKMNV